MSDEMVTLTIDGQEVRVPAGTLIIRAAEQLGTYIPRFCDHPLLEPLGACRQCLVEVEGQRKPLTSCTTTVTDGMVVKTQLTSELAADGQQGVLELLLINHPLDCPMCDKGGECPLQDQALAYGPGGSRFVDEKRRFTKPIPISDSIKLDRERCVLCARCTRFADQISGDPFIELFERGALEQISISPDEPYDSIFSGNVVQICPVGALTATPYRFAARPFDTTTTPSTCTRCASGCSIDVQERRGQLVRVLARADADVNDEWICDVGRWATGYVAAPERVTEPLVRKEGEFVAVSWSEAIELVAERLTEARGAGGVAVLGGRQLLDEDAYALSRFARTVLGTNDVDARVKLGGEDEDAVLTVLPATQTATMADIDAADVIVVAGCDLQQESPIVFLRVRKAARRGARVVEVGPRRTALADAGASWLACPPGAEAGAIVALSRALEEAGTSELDPMTRAAVSGAAPVAAAANIDRASAEELTRALGEARGAVVVLAGESLAADPGALPLAWNLAIGLHGTFGWVPRKAGTRGSLWAGLHPALLPAGRSVSEVADRQAVEDVWGVEVPSATGKDAAQILAAAGDLGAIVLAGSDPVSDGADPTVAERALGGTGFVVALDLFMTASAAQADVILPAAAAYERDGTITTWDGREQKVRAAVPPAGLSNADHAILAELAVAMGVEGFPSSLDAVRKEMERLKGVPGPARALTVATLDPWESEGGLAAVEIPALIDHGTMMTGAATLTPSPAEALLHPDDAASRGVADGSVVRARGPRGTIEVPARITDRIIAGAVGLAGGTFARLADGPGSPVTVEVP